MVSSGAGSISCSVAPESIDRLEIAVPKIVGAASLQGFELKTVAPHAAFRSASDTIKFSISEGVARETHVLTPAEVREQEAWDRKKERARRRQAWSYLW